MKATHVLVACLLVVMVVALLCAAGCGTKAEAKLWTCPMHPEVVQDHPGKCPKCGMDLVPKTDAGPAKSADTGK